MSASLIYSQRSKTLNASLPTHRTFFNSCIARHRLEEHGLINDRTAYRNQKNNAPIIISCFPLSSHIQASVPRKVNRLWIIENRRHNKLYITFNDEINLFAIARGDLYLKPIKHSPELQLLK